jgi:hypothetical protein
MPSPFAGTASCHDGHSLLYVSLFLTPVVSETNDTAIKASCQGLGDIDKPPEYDYIKG